MYWSASIFHKTSGTREYIPPLLNTSWLKSIARHTAHLAQHKQTVLKFKDVIILFFCKASLLAAQKELHFNLLKPSGNFTYHQV
jgi:hypothetical protein